MINLKNIQYQISPKTILENINLNIQEGKTTVIMGKNGSGKSTLLKLINQIIKPSSGFFESTLSKPVPMLFQKPLILQNSVNYNYQILQKINLKTQMKVKMMRQKILMTKKLKKSWMLRKFIH